MPDSGCPGATRIAMEYAHNGSLADVFGRISSGNIPSFWTHANISCMIIDLVLGMKYLHSKSIIHRDLKPGNLLIDRNYRLRICDFGISVFDTGATTVFAGTVQYVAPEYQNMPGSECHPTPKIDVFAFGLILYELITGIRCEELRKMLTEKERIDDSIEVQEYRMQYNHFVTKPIPKLIAQCCDADPNKRPGFDDIYERLERARFRFFDDVSSQYINAYLSKVRRDIVMLEKKLP
jgi:serine/threonine protein kinase